MVKPGQKEVETHKPQARWLVEFLHVLADELAARMPGGLPQHSTTSRVATYIASSGRAAHDRLGSALRLPRRCLRRFPEAYCPRGYRGLLLERSAPPGP